VKVQIAGAAGKVLRKVLHGPVLTLATRKGDRITFSPAAN
jgi:hypothetical protein